MQPLLNLHADGCTKPERKLRVRTSHHFKNMAFLSFFFALAVCWVTCACRSAPLPESNRLCQWQLGVHGSMVRSMKGRSTGHSIEKVWPRCTCTASVQPSLGRQACSSHEQLAKRFEDRESFGKLSRKTAEYLLDTPPKYKEICSREGRVFFMCVEKKVFFTMK